MPGARLRFQQPVVGSPRRAADAALNFYRRFPRHPDIGKRKPPGRFRLAGPLFSPDFPDILAVMDPILFDLSAAHPRFLFHI